MDLISMTTPFESYSRLRIIGISLSIACLYFFRVYRQLLDPAYDWYFEYDIPRLETWAALFCSLVVFCVFSGMLLLMRKHREGRPRMLLLILFALFGFMAFGPLSTELLSWCFAKPQIWFKYVLPVVLFVIGLLLRWREPGTLSRVTSNLATMMLIVLPFSILVFAHALLVAAGVLLSDLEPNAIEGSIASRDSNNSLRRVVWIVFDEFGQNPLSHRPSNIRLPAFDELTSSSFVAENAFPPHYWTSASLPALLTGRKVYWVIPHGPDKITLNFNSDEPSVELTETDTIFDDVLSLNGKNAAAGWYHPYPRLFRNKLAMGYWTPAGWYRCHSTRECISSTFANAFEDMPVLRDLFVENPVVDPSQVPVIRNRFLNHHREHAQYNLELREHAKSLVSNENIDFVFLHFAIPHGPYLNRNNESTHSYFEAFEAVDETLSILRDAMQRNNLWDRTTLIVSGDHWLRSNLNSPDGLEPKEIFEPDNTRVPFIVKPAGSGTPLRYTRPFNTVITRNLVTSIMTGEVSTTEEIAGWLDRMATQRPDLMNFHPCREIETDYALNRASTAVRLLTCK
jgi:hypothetical protein